MIDIQSLKEWFIIPTDIHKPQDPKEKVNLTKSAPKVERVQVRKTMGSKRTFIKLQVYM